MTLEEKGQIVPPPLLDKFPQQVSAEIQSWPQIIAATHWHLYDNNKPDGADFYLGKTELGHIHLNGEVHLATGKALKTILLQHQLAKKFPYGDDWALFQIRDTKDVAHATWLFQLNYKRIVGESTEAFLNEINQYIKSR